MMNSFIFLFFSLSFYICLYAIFIPMTTNRINIKTFCPKLSSPKFLFNLWMKFENLLCCNAFYHLNYPRWTLHWNTLNQKMNVVIICTNLNKRNLKTLGYLKANFSQTIVNSGVEYNSTVFGRTDKMIQQY